MLEDWDRASEISGKDGAVIRALKLISGCSVLFIHEGRKTTVADELTFRSTYESQKTSIVAAFKDLLVS